MKYIETQNEKNDIELLELNDKLDETKTKLTKAKNDRAKLEKQNQKLSQKTGIARDASLKVAYEDRKSEFTNLHNENQRLAEQHAQLCRIIKEARQVEQQAQFEMWFAAGPQKLTQTYTENTKKLHTKSSVQI